MEETARAGSPKIVKKAVASLVVSRGDGPAGLLGGLKGRGSGILAFWLLAALFLPAFQGCGLLFDEPARVDHPARDFWVRVKNRRGKTFARVESARKGKGPFDVQVVMRTGWALLNPDIREADAVALARTWVTVIRPVNPEQARMEFVDSEGRVLAWGLYQSSNGLFVGFGEGRPR